MTGVSVYPVCMARVNIYLPEDLARAAREADLNVSAIAREALEAALMVGGQSAWFDSLADLGPVDIGHEDVIQAVDEAREELGRWPR